MPGVEFRRLVLVRLTGQLGDTEFSRFLCEITGWALLDKDTLTRPLIERLLLSLGGDPHDRHTTMYLQDIRPLEYRCLMETAFDNLQAGTSVVLSAPFVAELVDPDWIAHLDDRCRSRGIDLAVVWMRCDIESMRNHIVSRGDLRDVWKLRNWESYASTLNTETSPPTVHVTIDNRLGAATYLTDQARNALKRIPLRDDAELDASLQRSS